VIWRCLRAPDRRRAPVPASPSSLSVVTDVVQAVDQPGAKLSTAHSVGLKPVRDRPEPRAGGRDARRRPRQRFWHVTVTLLAPGLATTFVLAFSVFPSAALVGQPSCSTRAPLHAHDARGAGDRACGSSTRRAARVAVMARNPSRRTRSPASSAPSRCRPTCFGVRTSSPPRAPACGRRRAGRHPRQCSRRDRGRVDVGRGRSGVGHARRRRSARWST